MPTRRDLDHGLFFLNHLLGEVRDEANALDADTWALVELLVAEGRLEAAAVVQRARAAEAAERERFEGTTGVQLRNEPDKRALTGLPEIDCAARLPLCQGRCCGLLFPLSLEDVHEGIVAWDLERPYLTRQHAGRCVHQDEATRACGVYADRPAACRTYDCRSDPRIWLDFDRRIPAPEAP
jgi:hypothetical protein